MPDYKDFGEVVQPTGSKDFGIPITDESGRPIAIGQDSGDESAFTRGFNKSLHGNKDEQEQPEDEYGLGEKIGGSTMGVAANIFGGFYDLGAWALDMIDHDWISEIHPETGERINNWGAQIEEALGIDYTGAWKRALGKDWEVQYSKEQNLIKDLNEQLSQNPDSYVLQTTLNDAWDRVNELRDQKVQASSMVLSNRLRNFSKDMEENQTITKARLNSDIVGAFNQGDVGGVAEAIGGTLIDLVGQAGASAMTSGVSMFAQGIGGTYSEAIEEGIRMGRSEDELIDDASMIITSGIAGLSIGYMEKLGLEKVFGPMNKVFQSRLKNSVTKSLTGFVTEGTTEGAQELAQIVGVDYANDSSEGILSKLGKALSDPEKSHRVLNAMILGGLGGHIAGGAHGLMMSPAYKLSEEDQAKVQDAIDLMEKEVNEGKTDAEAIGSVLTVIKEKEKKAQEQESIDRVKGIIPKTRSDVRKSLYKFFGFDENKVEDIEKVERTTDITMALIGAAAKRQGISTREWFQTNIAEIREGLPERSDVLDKLNQIMFHGSRESVEGINATTMSKGGLLHISPNLGVAGQFAINRGSKARPGIVNIFDAGGKFLRTEDSGKDYHTEKIGEALLKSGRLGRMSKQAVAGITSWINEGKNTRDVEKRLIDTGAITDSEWKNISKKRPNEQEAYLSMKMSGYLLDAGYDGIVYENTAESGIRPGGKEISPYDRDMLSSKEVTKEAKREFKDFIGEEVEGIKVGHENDSYAIANPRALIKLSEVASKSGSWDASFIKDIKKALGGKTFDILYQNDMDYQAAHAAVSFLKDGRAIISALESPNASSFLHEMAHIFGRQLTASDKKTVMEWAGEKEWNNKVEEKFARGFERYLAEGRAPLTKLELAFEKFKQWMTEIYNGITNSEIDIEISPEVQKVFDGLFDETTPEQKAKKEAKAAKKEADDKAKAEKEAKSKTEKEEKAKKQKEDAVQKPSTKKVDVEKQTTDGKEVGKEDTKALPAKESKQQEPVAEKTPEQIQKEKEEAEEAKREKKFQRENKRFKKWFAELKGREQYFDQRYVNKINKFIEAWGEDIQQKELTAYQEYIQEFVDFKEAEAAQKADDAKAQRKIDALTAKIKSAKGLDEHGFRNQIPKYLEKWDDLIDDKTRDLWLDASDQYKKEQEAREAKAEEDKIAKEEEEAALAAAMKEEGATEETAKKKAKSILKAADIEKKAKKESEKKKKTVSPVAKKVSDYLVRVSKIVAKKNVTYDELKQAKAMLDGVTGKYVDGEQMRLRDDLQKEVDTLMSLQTEAETKDKFTQAKKDAEKQIGEIYAKINEHDGEAKASEKEVDRINHEKLAQKFRNKLVKKIAEWNKQREEEFGKPPVSDAALGRLKRLGIKDYKAKEFKKAGIDPNLYIDPEVEDDLYGNPDILFQATEAETENMENELDQRLELIGALVTNTDPHLYTRKARQGHLVGKTISADIVDILVRIRDYMAMPVQTAMERLAAIQEKAEEEGRSYTQDELNEIELLNFAGFEGASVDRLQNMAHILSQIIEVGKSKKSEEIRKSNNEKVFANNLATGTLLGIKPDQIYNPFKTYQEGAVVFHDGAFRSINDKGVPHKGKSPLERAVKATAKIKGKQVSKRKGLMFIEKISGDFQTRLESLPSLLDKIAFRDKESKLFKTPLHRMISEPLRRATTREKTKNNADMTFVRGAAAKILGKNWRKVMRDNSVPKEVTLPLSDGTVFEYPDGTKPMFSQNQLAYIWLSWQQADVRESIEKGNGFGENTIEVIEKMLKPETRKWAEWQRDVFYKNSSKELKSAYRDAYGVDLPLLDNYVPINKVMDRQDESNLASTGDTGFMNASEVLNHFKERSNNKLPIEIVDMDAVLFRYILKKNHFTSFYKPARVFRSIVNNKNFRETVRADFGDTAVRVLKRFADDVTSGGAKIENSMKVLEKIRRNVVLSTLGLNLSMFPKQLSSFVAYSAHMPSGQWVKHEAKFWMNPYKNAKEILALPFIKDRLDSGQERDMLELLKTEGIAGKNRKRNLIDKAMIVTKYGDVGAIILGGWPLYNYYKGKYGAEKGYEKFVDATSNTQQSGDIIDLSDIQRGYMVNKLFTTFMTTPLQYFRLGSAASRRLLQGRGSTKENIKVVGTYMFLLPALFSIASGSLVGAFSDDEEEQKDAWFDFGLDSIAMWLGQGIPIWNSILNSLVGHAKGKHYPFRLTPAQKSFEEFISAGNKGIDVFSSLMGDEPADADAWVDFSKKLAVASADLGGIPIKPASRTFFNALELATGEQMNPFMTKEQQKKQDAKNKQGGSSVRNFRRKSMNRSSSRGASGRR